MTAIGPMPDGSRGFDCNNIVGASEARLMKRAGFDFALRYVKRDRPHSWDASQNEVLSLLNAGIGVMLVQHVAPAGWLPTAALGMIYGDTAADEAQKVGIPFGVNLWCDLEGVQTGAHADDVIHFCNEWHEAVERKGYLPGLYVGDQCGLSAKQLYHDLRFTHYWRAYNLNDDKVPARRGFQMRQYPYPERDARAPVGFEYDTDVIMKDKLGGSPVVFLP